MEESLHYRLSAPYLHLITGKMTVNNCKYLQIYLDAAEKENAVSPWLIRADRV